MIEKMKFFLVAGDSIVLPAGTTILITDSDGKLKPFQTTERLGFTTHITAVDRFAWESELIPASGYAEKV